MVETKQTAEVMDSLKEVGATDILLLSLSNCRS